MTTIVDIFFQRCNFANIVDWQKLVFEVLLGAMKCTVATIFFIVLAFL